MTTGGAAVTSMVKGEREALPVPLATDIETFESSPTSPLAGVPLSVPFVLLKLAHPGLLEIEKVSVPPPGSVVVGVKE
jgi:hypothetical protein